MFLIATLLNGKEVLGYAEKGNHTFRQKVCKICGKPFWPSNGQEEQLEKGDRVIVKNANMYGM